MFMIVCSNIINHHFIKAFNNFYLYLFQSMFDYLDNAVIKLCDMSTVGTDLGTVKQQIEELKVGMRVSFFLTFEKIVQL